MDTIDNTFTYPLTWGWSLPKLKEKWGSKLYYNDRYGLALHYIMIKTFPGDCGALTINNIGTAQKEHLKDIIELASENGFSKIFGTIVQKMTSKQCEEKKNLFTNLGWTLVSEGKSNRNPEKTDLVFVYVNHNCNHKGY
ncbi:MAG: hypothetical protein HGA25_07385 [Clostridiales bacterium]|nr:hypothetical protein [Clostridiales bacterium]